MRCSSYAIKQRGSSGQEGYTLLEIAVVTLIIGIMFAIGASAYKLYKIEKDNNQTELARVRTTLAIDSFRERFGRYPCPARYDLERDHVDYGMEGNCADTSVSPGNCTSGICIEESVRTVTRDDGTTFVPRVRRGAVPFRALNLTEGEFYDAFGGRFSYAVTENLTNDMTFDVREGGISVVDGQTPVSQTLIEPEGSALYFLFSHGRDNVGAYDWNGNQMLPCNGPMFDVENCNTEEDAEAVYRSAKPSDVPVVLGGSSVPVPGGPPPPVGTVNTHYDDFSTYKGADFKPLWKNSEDPAATPDDAHDLLDTEVVVLGAMPLPTGDDRLMVEQDIRATGNMRGELICNADGVDCFEPDYIAGTGDSCVTGTGFYGIRNADLDCVAPDVRCDPGYYFRGFDDVTGAKICDEFEVVVRCNPMTTTLCGASRTVPPSGLQVPEHHVATITAGASRTTQFRCERSGSNPLGIWVPYGTPAGVCTCSPSTTTVTNGATSCGTGYTGHTTTTTTRVCPSGTTTSTTSRAACVCVPGTQTQVIACASPLTGAGTPRTRTISCVAGSAVFGPWVNGTSSCTCNARPPETQNLACPTYHTGTRTQTRVWNNTGGLCAWGPWVITDNCTCSDTTESRNVACAAPLSGLVLEQRTFECSTGTHTPWAEVSNTCNCAVHPVNRTVACPAGEIGTIVQQRDENCVGETVPPTTHPAQNWVEVSNTCREPPQCMWKKSTTLSSLNIGPEVGIPGSCTCGDVGRCRERIGTNTFQGYQNCRCEE